MVSHLTTQILKCFTTILWFYFLADSQISCLAKLAKPYPVSSPIYFPQGPNQLHCISHSGYEVLVTIPGARLMPVFTTKSFGLFIKD